MSKNYIVYLQNGEEIEVNNIIQVNNDDGVYYLKEKSDEFGGSSKTIFTTAVENVKYIITK